MEADRIVRTATSQEWEAFWSLRRLVWGFRGLRGEPKGLWEALWWDCQLWRGGAVDVTAAQLAHVIGAADAKSGRSALTNLKNAGLVIVHYEDAISGYKTISMPDPRDVLLARRHGDHGEAELFDRFADEQGVEHDRTHPEQPPETLRLLGSVTAGPATPPASRRPNPAHTTEPDGSPHVRERAPPERGASAGGCAAAHVPALAPRPNLENLDQKNSDNLNFAQDRSSSALRFQSGRGGASSRTCAAAAASPFATALARLSIEGADGDEAVIGRKTRWLQEQVPGLWYEIARWVIEELMDVRGKSKFGAHELSKILSKTLGKHERGELKRPPAVYFAGACEMRFRQLGREWPRFVAGKPR